MKLLSFFSRFTPLSGVKKSSRKTIADYKQELLVKQGREQFTTLLKRGLSIPVVLL